MKRFCLFLLIVILVSCSSQKVSVVHYKNTNDSVTNIDYSNYWSALVCVAPDSALVKADSNIEKRSLANALNLITQNKSSSAIDTLILLKRATQNDTVNTVVNDLLLHSLEYQSRYKDIYDIFKKTDESEYSAKKRLLMPEFIGMTDETPNFAKDCDTIPMNVSYGFPFVKVKINGKEYEFLFDTGCEFTVLTDETAKDCGIKNFVSLDTALVSSINKKNDIQLGVIKDLILGSYSTKKIPCMIVEKSSMSYKFLFISLFSIDGVIGWDLMKKLDFTMDYKNERLILRKPIKKDNPKNNLFWMVEPIVKAKTKSGKPLNFVFDSGANKSDTRKLFFQKYTDIETEETSKTMWGVGGEDDIKGKRIKEVSFILGDNEIRFKNFYQGAEPKQILYFDGVLGGDICKNGAVHIDATNGIFELISE